MMMTSAAQIIVIDDNADVVDILTTYLADEGYRVSGALSGDDGLHRVISSHPDLVILDIALPGNMNGIEMLKRIRSIAPTTKVVVVSGNTDSVLAREALELGALAYIDKPFDLDYLKRVVAMALEPEDTLRGNRPQAAVVEHLESAGLVAAWSGLEYLSVPQWRTAFEMADTIFGVDVATGEEILVFGRDALQMIPATGADHLRVLRISIDTGGDDLEVLLAACEIYRGRHDYEAGT
jgi:two-component system response regulator (stage 0 sporulation protein F)